MGCQMRNGRCKGIGRDEISQADLRSSKCSELASDSQVFQGTGFVGSASPVFDC